MCPTVCCEDLQSLFTVALYVFSWQLRPGVCLVILADRCTSMVRTSSLAAKTSAPAWTEWLAACPFVLNKCPCLTGAACDPGWSGLRMDAAKNGCVMMTTISVKSQASWHTPLCMTASPFPITLVPCCRPSCSFGLLLPPDRPHSEVKPHRVLLMPNHVG